MGYFSYDYLGYSEPSVRAEVEDREEFRDLDLMLFDKVIAFDHLRQKLILMVNMSLDEPETGYNKAVLELRQLAELLRTGAKQRDHAGRLLGPVEPLFGRGGLLPHGGAGQGPHPGRGYFSDRPLQLPVGPL